MPTLKKILDRVLPEDPKRAAYRKRVTRERISYGFRLMDKGMSDAAVMQKMHSSGVYPLVSSRYVKALRREHNKMRKLNGASLQAD